MKGAETPPDGGIGLPHRLPARERGKAARARPACRQFTAAVGTKSDVSVDV